MLKWLNKTKNALLYDELAFVRWVRGGLMALSATAATCADNLTPFLSDGAIGIVKVLSVMAGFAAGAITAGERNRPIGRPRKKSPNDALN